MKRTLLLLFFLNAILCSLTAQDSLKTNQSELCVKKGKMMIDGYYGLPYLAGNIVKTFFTDNTLIEGDIVSIESFSNLNHIGGKFEYMVTKDISIGLEYTYASILINYKVENYLNINNQNTIEGNVYKATLSKNRLLFRFNYHFETSKKMDPYASIGIGYKSSKLKTNNTNDKLAVAVFNAGFNNLFPISYRGAIGVRYFFSPNFGLNLEAGFGGPIIQAGLTGKF